MTTQNTVKTDPIGTHDETVVRREWVSILGVDYLHLLLEDGADLYLNRHGLPFARQLFPRNYWTDREWFAEHHQKLPGSSTLYRIQTRPVDGQSKDIVLKWSRMGQDIPGETAVNGLTGAKFNSPFQEFGLVRELRQSERGNGGAFYTHKPLGIYVPRQFVESERMGRKSYWMQSLQRNHKEVALDPNRRYAVLYEWVKGIDAAMAWDRGVISERDAQDLVRRANRDMEARGFRVRDNKPHHVIVRPRPDGGLAVDQHGDPLYALVDFELLERTPEHEEEVRASRREDYLARQASRFEGGEDFPEGLYPVEIMGVDYVYGHVESTGGALWVVGKDPELFEYFLPEKWREAPKENLSTSGKTYETTTMDDIHLVSRVSRVGKVPVNGRLDRSVTRMLTHGYNSPFEEVALSFDLGEAGIKTTYPRAIYMSGHREDETITDRRRYRTHRDITTPDGHPVLSEHHRYVSIWGYWNGPDERLAEKDEDYYRSIDARRAFKQGYISEVEYDAILADTSRSLSIAGVEDLNLKGTHLLLSIDRSGELVRGDEGLPQVRICNFELLKRTGQMRNTGGPTEDGGNDGGAK